MISVRDQMSLYAAIGLTLMRAGFRPEAPNQLPAYDAYGTITNTFTRQIGQDGECKIDVTCGDPAAVTCEDPEDGAQSKGISIIITHRITARYFGVMDAAPVYDGISMVRRISDTILSAADITYDYEIEGDTEPRIETGKNAKGNMTFDITNDLYFWSDEDLPY